MPVSTEQANALLAEFMAKRDGTPITRYTQRVRGPKVAAYRPDPLEKIEYQPDNSQIGCQSSGIQSDWTSHQWLAEWMVYDWHLSHPSLVPYMAYPPLVPSTPFVIVRMPSNSYTAPVARVQRKTQVTEVKAPHPTYHSVSQGLNQKQENKSWKSQRTPRTYQ